MSCILKWGEWSSETVASGLLKVGRVLCGASCLGASCLWGELSVIHVHDNQDIDLNGFRTTRPKDNSALDNSAQEDNSAQFIRQLGPVQKTTRPS